MTWEITREMFLQATGSEPDQDDLERCNCPMTGFGHTQCGWNQALNKPRFMCTRQEQGES